jgi:hypothetical protein
MVPAPQSDQYWYGRARVQAGSPQPRGAQMRKVLAVFVAVAMAAGIVVL